MTNTEGSPPALPEIKGQASPESYAAKTADGSASDLSKAVFPIVRYDESNRFHLLGTGFFITTSGLFVTAKHVLLDPFDKHGREKYPIGLIQFYGERRYLHRPILRFAPHPIADLAVGVAAPMASKVSGAPLTNPVVTVTLVPPDINARIVTFAYPKHANLIEGDLQKVNFEPTYYDGDLVEYFPDGRDRVMLPGPCYRTSIVIHGGASGGPVFSSSGDVFGVNSTGYGDEDISFVTRINEITELTIDGVQIGDGKERSVEVTELIQAGFIAVASG